jgi:sugar fermentation stimulation protein A
MELPLPPLLPCRILRRANRFVVEADVGPLHLANTGRLTELLLPGTRGHYHPRPTAKTRGRLYLVEREGVLVGVDATLAGPLLERLLRAGRYGPLEALRREVGLQGERLDFWARVGGREAFFEAKNANRLEGALALLKTLPQVASARLQGRSVVFEGEPEAALRALLAEGYRVRALAPHRFDLLDYYQERVRHV